MRRCLATLVASMLIAACGGHSPPPRAPSAVASEPLPPPPEPEADGRLPPLATPTRYALDLEIDPAEARFGGAARIAVLVPNETSYVVLHASNLDVSSAHAELDGRVVPARASTRRAASGAAPSELVLAFSEPLPAGEAQLVIEYEAPFDEGLSGLYRVREGDRFYAFTRLEATAARRAFPCFDEPRFKVPFDVSVTVPRAMIAVANAPEVAREEAPAGRTRFRFATTRPLPTHLVALAVGDLELVSAERYSRPALRAVTTKGNAGMTSLALEAASGLIDELAAWFDVPYPYEKLDLVAAPALAGAAGGAGLIAVSDDGLLLDGSRSSLLARRAQARLLARALARQWAGDSVTAAGWDDAWVDDGLSTWTSARALERWRPMLGARLDLFAASHEAMDADGLSSARAVRATTRGAPSAGERDKGAAVLAMIEGWIGEDAFQRGVRAYLRDNADESVAAERLLSALDLASGKDVTQLASSFAGRAGVPEVSAELTCARGGRWHVELTSQRWRPLGSTLPEDDDDEPWMIPVCVRARGSKTDACAELMAGAPSLVAGRGGCPSFVHPNAGGGYYRFTLSGKGFTQLARGHEALDAASRVSLLSSAWAAVRSGAVEAKVLLQVLPAFDDDPTPHVTAQIVQILRGMSDALVDEDARGAFRSFARARLAKRKATLGWAPSAKRPLSVADALARRSVLRAMADLAEDEDTLREAEPIASAWLYDRASVDPDTGALALELASRRAGDARVEQLLAAAKGAPTREDRRVALVALMGFDDERLLGRGLEAVLGEDVRASEVTALLSSALARRATRAVTEAFVRARWRELLERGALADELAGAAAVGCSAEEAAERAAFYGPRVEAAEGAGPSLTAALESVSLCAALRATAAPSLRKALSTPAK